MSERDQILTNYAKASGAFQYAANVCKRNRNEKNLQEAKQLIDKLVNEDFRNVEEYCIQHKNDKDIDSLLAIAKADCDTMKTLCESL